MVRVKGQGHTLSKREVPRGVRNSKVRRQDKFRRDSTLLLNLVNIKQTEPFQLETSKELARIHGKSAHLANCSQLFKKSFLDKNIVPLATTFNY